MLLSARLGKSISHAHISSSSRDWGRPLPRNPAATVIRFAMPGWRAGPPVGGEICAVWRRRISPRARRRPPRRRDCLCGYLVRHQKRRISGQLHHPLLAVRNRLRSRRSNSKRPPVVLSLSWRYPHPKELQLFFLADHSILLIICKLCDDNEQSQYLKRVKAAFLAGALDTASHGDAVGAPLAATGDG